MGQLIPQPHGGAVNRWMPGESGNPKGRKSLGAYVSECINALATEQPSVEECRKRLRGKEISSNMRIALVRYVRMMEHPDVADFEPVLDGQKSLRELRTEGVDTAVVRKVKTKKRYIPNGDDPPVEEVEREIELYDRSGQEFDRVLDRTDGKPHESQEIEVNVTVAAEQLSDQQLIERAARLFASDPAKAIVDVPAVADGEPKALPEQ